MIIHDLTLINIPKDVDSLILESPEAFRLQTCQRTLYLGHALKMQNDPRIEVMQGKDAYRFLLETICGLKSQILAESEITSQFKEAYTQYLAQEVRSSRLIRLLEKLFQDAKTVRTRYLNEVGQQSYSGIGRKLLLQKAQTGPVLVLGSGSLAQDFLKILKKRFTLTLSARNSDKLKTFCQEQQITMAPWKHYDQYLQFPFIINTIGADDTTLFNQSFFQLWDQYHPLNQRLFIDLGSPSVLDTSLGSSHNVIRLEDVFKHGVLLGDEKKQRVEKALNAIEDLATKRDHSFSLSYPFGWEDLNFA